MLNLGTRNDYCDTLMRFAKTLSYGLPTISITHGDHASTNVRWRNHLHMGCCQIEIVLKRVLFEVLLNTCPISNYEL